MATQLIELEDGTLIEVEVPNDQARQISNRFASKVNKTLDDIKPMLLNVCRPVTETFREINKEMEVDQAEVEIGFSFEGEGNLYITKAKANANLVIKLVLKPKKTL
ncbi:hypothetical protein IQ260_06570 [Leptolyngbya cf. ectocarpi LEGE 11479]|uniref:Trypsin-co-occurring domain-containing protein n=1 Tax=Leptolyngbya cf. ectocarpi LEGE 11479 TaxID=1828722 RepID=A0A928ZSI7_LEPEC|nr:CU044_2847 family protein [Leptolyngbya ectocarpi]MBE9066312.1 hypothetical protein [Leptolyngbya cf. ectocarpi LEGE 11479]